MRILIYSINYAPELTGIGKYNAEMANWLSQRGHEISIITAPPYYPWWQVQYSYKSWQYRIEALDNVKVFRCPLWVPRHPTSIKRLLHLASFALASIPPLLINIFKRPDVLVVLEPTLFCSPAAVFASRLIGAKTWLHVQDFEVDAALGLGMVNNKKIAWFASAVEKWLMNRFDHISTISEKMLERLVRKGVNRKRCTLMPNWVDGEEIFPKTTESSFRNKLGIGKEKCVALYSGNMGEKQGLEILLEAAKLLRNEPNLAFVLCGDGSARDRLMKMGENLANITWLQLQPIEQLNELLNLADVHLLPQRSDVADLVMPSKLLGMLASGRPVLATAQDGTQLAKVVSSCGKIVDPGNAEDMAKKLLDLQRNSAERIQLGKMARETAKYWDKATVLSDFENRLKALCDK